MHRLCFFSAVFDVAEWSLTMNLKHLRQVRTALIVALVLCGGSFFLASAQTTVKGQNIKGLLSSGGGALYQATHRHTGLTPFALPILEPEDGVIPPSQLGGDPGPDPAGGEANGNGSGFSNVFVNDPCSDPAATAPFPANFMGVVQSETEIAVLNRVRGQKEGDEGDQGDNGQSGRLMVAGYNDSLGFYNNRQGLSGYSYSTDGGKNWIDGSGLPPIVKSGAPAGTPGSDAYFGDPVVVVHYKTKTFYYSSIYQTPEGLFTLSVNRGHFEVAPPQGVESKANTRCADDPSKFGTPDPPAFIRERIIWEPPVVAVPPPFLGPDPNSQNDFLDKEWLYVDQRTGFLYLTYTRFGADGSTPIELVRSFDGGRTFTPPTVIVPNLDDTFNTATQPVVTPTGRVIVSWIARTFLIAAPFTEINNRIEAAFSDDGGNTFSLPVRVNPNVNPQGEPKGYNRGRTQILNAPYIMVDQGINDGMEDENGNDEEGRRSGFSNVYITYFDGKTPLGQVTKAADIKLSTSTDDGTTYQPPVTVNDDNTNTSHVFPSVQVNKHGTVFVTWIDRRVDPVNNILNDTWAAFSHDQANNFGSNVRVTNVSTDWFARADARPNFGDYNSSEVINFEKFVSIWSDARFPEGTFVFRGRTRRQATPDTLFAIVGNGSDNNNGDEGNSSKKHR